MHRDGFAARRGVTSVITKLSYAEHQKSVRPRRVAECEMAQRRGIAVTVPATSNILAYATHEHILDYGLRHLILMEK